MLASGLLVQQHIMAAAASPHPVPLPPQISLTAVAIALAKAHQSNMPQAERLLAINLTGLFTNLIIGWGAWTVVRHRTFRTCDPTVIGYLSKATSRSCLFQTCMHAHEQ